MRRIIFIIGMTLGMCFCVCARGQVKNDIWSEVSTHLSMYGSSNNHMEVSYTLGYNFTERFAAGLNLEESVTLFKIDSEKDHYVNTTIGAKLSYDIFKKLIAIQAGSGVTCDNKPWKYLYYDAMICFKTEIGKVVPTLGLGIRYYDSMSKSFGNYFRGYVSLGCIVVM